MKFTYTNSTGENALFEATPLTEDLYLEILKEDKEILTNISTGNIANKSLSGQNFQNAAQQMLENFNKIKNSSFEKSDKEEDSCVLVVNSKQVLKEAESERYKPKTDKALIRQNLASSKIRMFKKSRMALVLDV